MAVEEANPGPSSEGSPPYKDPAALQRHVDRAWAYFRSLGSPKFHVAPMVDQSDLPFRLLCRAHGATAAYTPMLHARLFLENKGYRAEHFTTCHQDRPLFVQFCANEPALLVEAAKLVQSACDYVDLNLGCPQRIAKRGNYGAFLMDDLPRVEALVTAAAAALSPARVSVKIRLFPRLEDTLAYARMLQAAGCSLLAVHGRTRDMKDATVHRADWDAIAAVVRAVSIPVLANGDVRGLADAQALMDHTGAVGVLSAEPLLMNPALFSSSPPEAVSQSLAAVSLARAYMGVVADHPVHLRMVKGHLHKMLAGWLAEFTDLRDTLNRGGRDLAGLAQLVEEVVARVAATGRDYPVPALSERKLRQMERAAAQAAAIAEQEREAAALAELSSAGMQEEQEPAAAATAVPSGLGSASWGEQQGGSTSTAAAAAAGAAVAADAAVVRAAVAAALTAGEQHEHHHHQQQQQQRVQRPAPGAHGDGEGSPAPKRQQLEVVGSRQG